MTSPASASTTLAIVLAAGEGTRMKSAKPKVLHGIGGRSMLGHVLAGLGQAGVDSIAVVVGPNREDVAAEARKQVPEADVFVQVDRLGTAHAVLAARAALERGFDKVLVVFADTPLIRAETFTGLKDALDDGAGVVVLGFEPEDPTGYGRILLKDGKVAAIREHKDASDEERKVRLSNAGLMALNGRRALEILGKIGNSNAQGEYYLTDVVEIAPQLGLAAKVIVAPETEVMGVNDRVQLSNAEAVLQNRLRTQAMRDGVTMQDPASTYLSFDTKFGRDVVIEPHVVFGPGVTLGDNVVIHAFSHLEGATLENSTSIGPFARLRPGAYMEETSRIGNFVEIKASRLGKGAKVNHLSYIGDASIGAGSNIGAGVITCNYDGFKKYKTIVGEGAFVGVNTALVAPVTVGNGAYIGTGSVITKDVEADALAVARARPFVKSGWAANFREKNKK